MECGDNNPLLISDGFGEGEVLVMMGGEAGGVFTSSLVVGLGCLSLPNAVSLDRKECSLEGGEAGGVFM